jgi:hypothetical protein
MDFGGAIHTMKGGDSVYRQSWARGIFLMIQKPDDHSKMTRPFIYQQSGEMDSGVCVPWTPTQEDMLTEDWAMGVG